MKRRSKIRNIWLIILAVLIALGMMLSSSLSGGKTGLLERAVKGFYAPAQKGAAQIERWIGDLKDYISAVDALREENARLNEEITRLHQQLRQSEVALKENEELRTLLNLTKSNSDFTYCAADVISGSSSNYSADFTIDLGSADGLDVGMCVVSKDGCVIGSISSVGSGWATVTTVLDPACQISAVIEGSKDVGVAGGDYTLMPYNKLLLKYLPGDADIHLGDTVVTTGAGGIYPAGLIIGYIDSVSVDISGMSDNAVLSPAAQLEGLSQVFIIVSDKSEGGGE
ncbi:MAG: rod shape-determining protein MreC [Oscillospiraceae bacterium]|nr:rod shape-determining protein MreC [Oscillospiraceae bacterium]